MPSVSLNHPTLQGTGAPVPKLLHRCPLGHGAHTEFPTPLAYVPRVQSSQAAPPVLALPALHESQPVFIEFASVPSGHAAQSSTLLPPAISLYMLCGHVGLVPSPGQKRPAGQVFIMHADALVPDQEPAIVHILHAML